MNIFRVVFYIFLLFIFFIFDVYSQEQCEEIKNRRANRAFNEAMKALDRADNARDPSRYYHESSKYLLEVAEIEEDFAGTYYFLCHINIFKPNFNIATAIKYCLMSIEKCPDYNPAAYYYLGKIAYGREDIEETIKYFSTFLKYRTKITNDEYIVDAEIILNTAKIQHALISDPIPFEPGIVEGISSPMSEYLVYITADNELAFYTRQTEVYSKAISFYKDYAYEEKFFYSERQKNDKFDSGREMPLPFNRSDNEGGATLTINNKELFYTVCNYITCEGVRYYNCDIYYSKYEQGFWSNIESLSDKINHRCSWESMPSISADGQTLYFVSNRHGGIGGYDIYKTKRQEDGTWNEPVNLGPKINTKGNEKSPFMHTDSQTLYFSTDGRPGVGGYDIFFSKLNDDGTWNTPKNIGYPINSKYNDIGFIVSTDGKYGYFASNQLENTLGGWDFYSFELHHEAKPEKVLFIKGEVTDEKQKTSIDATVEIKNIETRKVHRIEVDQETGKYVVALPFKNDYVLTVKKEDYVYESKYIAKEDTTFDAPTVVDMALKPIEIGKSYKLNDIYFEFDSAQLTEASKTIIHQFVEFLNDNPKISIAIHGHTDNIAGAVYNQDLSERRAKSVYDYLTQNGISANRLSYKGFGLTQPVATNATEEGRALNRRTEFVIQGK